MYSYESYTGNIFDLTGRILSSEVVTQDLLDELIYISNIVYEIRAVHVIEELCGDRWQRRVLIDRIGTDITLDFLGGYKTPIRVLLSHYSNYASFWNAYELNYLFKKVHTEDDWDKLEKITRYTMDRLFRFTQKAKRAAGFTAYPDWQQYEEYKVLFPVVHVFSDDMSLESLEQTCRFLQKNIKEESKLKRTYLYDYSPLLLPLWRMIERRKIAGISLYSLEERFYRALIQNEYVSGIYFFGENPGLDSKENTLIKSIIDTPKRVIEI
ncbi:MAG: hypothetical protein R3B64_00070 [Candidatus Paceibacterota bacterium]